jgi:hypothetical protein
VEFLKSVKVLKYAYLRILAIAKLHFEVLSKGMQSASTFSGQAFRGSICECQDKKLRATSKNLEGKFEKKNKPDFWGSRDSSILHNSTFKRTEVASKVMDAVKLTQTLPASQPIFFWSNGSHTRLPGASQRLFILQRGLGFLKNID